MELWVKFQRNKNAIHNPWKPNQSEYTPWGKFNENNIVEQIHSTAFSNLNLHLYVNNTDEFYQKINNYRFLKKRSSAK